MAQTRVYGIAKASIASGCFLKVRIRSRNAGLGLIATGTTNTRSIPYFNVLWAEIVKGDLTIHYAKPSSKSVKSAVRVAYINYALENSTTQTQKAERWVERLLDRAYGPAQRKKRIKVLINPFGGAGKAVKQYSQEIEPIFAAARCEVDAERTTHKGHAIEIAQNLHINAYDVLASCSGDGLPHECINGLAKKPNAAEALRKVAIVQLPCGTGNGMSWNLTGTAECSTAALCIVKGVRTTLDLVSITQGSTRTLSFLSQSLGLVAESDLGTENVRWMGDLRFTYGFLVRLIRRTVYPIDIAVKTEIQDKLAIKQHYAQQIATRSKQAALSASELDGPLDTSTGLGLPPLQYGTVNDPLPVGNGWTEMQHYPNLGNFYCGNMAVMAADAPFFPASLPSDGLMDLVTVDGDIARRKAIDLLLSVPNNAFFDKESVSYRKVSAVRVIPRYGSVAASSAAASEVGIASATERAGRRRGKKDGFFAVDGEAMPCEPFQLEVHRALGTVLSRRVGVYEASPGPKGWEQIDTSTEDAGQRAPSE